MTLIGRVDPNATERLFLAEDNSESKAKTSTVQSWQSVTGEGTRGLVMSVGYKTSGNHRRQSIASIKYDTFI